MTEERVALIELVSARLSGEAQQTQTPHWAGRG